LALITAGISDPHRVAGDPTGQEGGGDVRIAGTSSTAGQPPVIQVAADRDLVQHCSGAHGFAAKAVEGCRAAPRYCWVPSPNPRSSTMERGERAGRDPRQSGARIPTVLVVDDDEDIRESLAEAVELEGYDVRKASNGAEAIAMMKAALPDLLLLDLMMPGMNGWMVLDAMEADRRLAGVPVFIVTAVPNVSAVRTGYPIFTKPLSVARMMRTVRAFLSPPR
jgi:CheY-like chemotaxis protein